VFFEENTVRDIPEAAESNRALAGISMSNVGTLGSRQSNFGVGSNSDVYGHKQSSLDIESGVSSSHRSSTNLRRRYRTMLSTGYVSSSTSGRLQVMSLAPSNASAEGAPFPAESDFDLAPAELYGRLEDDLQQFILTLETDNADRSLFVERWRYMSCLFYSYLSDCI
jgi:hypothetical protein